MKKLLLILFSISCICNTYSQSPTIQVSGRNLIGVCGDTIILHGIDYAPFDWGWNIADEKFSDIAKTRANCVRIVWYSSSNIINGNAPLYNDVANLDTAVARCIRNKMIPIIELHDNTCNSDLSQITSLSNWYLGADVIDIINKYSHNLIINIENEAGYVAWSSSPTALTDFESTYESIVSNFRNAGIKVPLMIDAPDCGTNLDTLAYIAKAMETADPNHNIIFSAHAYWWAYADNDSLTMRKIITNALTKGVPIILGEVADLQDGTTNCEYALNYKPLLKICRQLNVGWIAWSWDEDVCSARQISSDGTFANLTTYGNDIVNNSIYGLKQHAALTNYLANNQSCSEGTGMQESKIQSSKFQVQCYPNPANEQSVISFKLSVKTHVNISVYDLTGREVALLANDMKDKGEYKIKYNTIDLKNGIYLCRLTAGEFSYTQKMVVLH